MSPEEIKAVRWLFNQPPLSHPTVARQYPVDFKLISLSSRPLPLLALPAIRKRCYLYSEAGCPKDQCVKAALRDFHNEVAA